MTEVANAGGEAQQSGGAAVVSPCGESSDSFPSFGSGGHGSTSPDHVALGDLHRSQRGPRVFPEGGYSSIRCAPLLPALERQRSRFAPAKCKPPSPRAARGCSPLEKNLRCPLYLRCCLVLSIYLGCLQPASLLRSESVKAASCRKRIVLWIAEQCKEFKLSNRTVRCPGILALPHSG